MWRKNRTTSRWSNLKTEKPSSTTIENNISREPLKTNSRWASLKTESSPRRERMNHSFLFSRA